MLIIKIVQNEILLKTLEHLQLCFFSVFFAILLALPLAVFLARSKYLKFSSFILHFCTVIQTIPGLALIALVVSVLVFLKDFFPINATGFFPAIIILTIYGFLPILTGSYTGIRMVSSNLKDVAKGLSMNSMQILLYVEIPMSLPHIINGVRLSFVTIIGMATLTSLIGSGGLGDFIMQGLRSMQIQLILAGTIPAMIIAILFNWVISIFDHWVTAKVKD